MRLATDSHPIMLAEPSFNRLVAHIAAAVLLLPLLMLHLLLLLLNLSLPALLLCASHTLPWPFQLTPPSTGCPSSHLLQQGGAREGGRAAV